MNHSILSKQTPKNTIGIITPHRTIIQNILNYSKTMQVKKTIKADILFFMNN
jgi:hypothetical protein